MTIGLAAIISLWSSTTTPCHISRQHISRQHRQRQSVSDMAQRRNRIDSLDYWETKEGKRALKRIEKQEKHSTDAQFQEAAERLRQDGWVVEKGTGQFVQLSHLRKKTFACMTPEAQEKIRAGGHRGREYGEEGKKHGEKGKKHGQKGKKYGIRGKGPWNYWGKGFGYMGRQYGDLGGKAGQDW